MDAYSHVNLIDEMQNEGSLLTTTLFPQGPHNLNRSEYGGRETFNEASLRLHSALKYHSFDDEKWAHWACE